MKKLIFMLTITAISICASAQKNTKTDTTAAAYIDPSGEIKMGWVVRITIDTFVLKQVGKTDTYQKTSSRQQYYFVQSIIAAKDSLGHDLVDSFGRLKYEQKWNQVPAQFILQDFNTYMRQGGKFIERKFLEGITGTAGARNENTLKEK